MENFVSKFLSNEAAASFITKTARITFLLLICSLLYSLVELREWYILIKNIPSLSDSPRYDLYHYIVWPAIYLIDIIAIIAGSVLNYKGFKYLDNRDAQHEDASIAKGFKSFYYAYIIFLASTLMLLLDGIYRSFVMN